MNRIALSAVFAALLLVAGLAPAADAGPAPLGASYPCGRGGLADAGARLDRMRGAGFPAVAFVPNYPYVGLNRIDFAAAPGFDELGAAVEAALRRGMSVVVKPHLEPAMYSPGFDSLKSEEHGWRIRTSWRGFFDVDPMSVDYREGLILPTLAMLKKTLSRLDSDPAFTGKMTPIRLELGTELMDSVVYQPERWEALLQAARKETLRLGLGGRVLLSHNFSHHFEIPEDFVNRMPPAGRKALARYIKGLDALAVSQYMDLTAAQPAAERGTRLPTVPEIAEALRLHERNLRRDVLQGLLGLKPAELPQFHIGEFGVGRGGLRHPNLWEGTVSGAEAEALAHEIALGHRGLLAYLREDGGRTARSATLWLTGRYYDLFGWMNPADALPEAAAAVAAGLGGKP